MDFIPPEGYKLLNTIAGTESPGYDVMYGGRRFSGYADHPRVAVPIGSGPNAGKTSTAAGRYQFLASTWDQQARKLGLTDFSPANQDIAAWDLARTNYSRTTGRDLQRDLQDPSQMGRIATALSGTWTSLPGGIEQAGGGASRFSNAFQQAAAGSPAPAGAADYGISTPQVSAGRPQASFNPFSGIQAPKAPAPPTLTRGKTPNLADIFSQNLVVGQPGV